MSGTETQRLREALQRARGVLALYDKNHWSDNARDEIRRIDAVLNESETDRLRRLLAEAQRLLVHDTPYPNEDAWWAEVNEVLS